MRKAAEDLQVGDRLVNPKTGEHVSTVVETRRDYFQIGNRDQYPEEERVVLTVRFEDGREVTRGVSLHYHLEVIE